MIKGIDVSHHNGTSAQVRALQAYRDSDFVIVKATQGTSYGYSDFFTSMCDYIAADGKLMGAYHYASDSGTAVQQADYFHSRIESRLGTVLPVLDFEQNQNTSHWGDYSFALDFCTRFHDLTGIWPAVYIQASAIARVASCADNCALWVAGYPSSGNDTWDAPAFPYSIAPWDAWAIWQYTSANGMDRNIAQLTATTWHAIATGGGAFKPDGGSDSTVSEDDEFGGSVLLELLYRTMTGEFGDGDARAARLTTLYDEVQDVINHIASASALTLANETLSGSYGNGDVRKTVLGSRYNEVQSVVNNI